MKYKITKLLAQGVQCIDMYDVPEKPTGAPNEILEIEAIGWAGDGGGVIIHRRDGIRRNIPEHRIFWWESAPLDEGGAS